MNTILLIPIFALGIGATIQYFFGSKKNRWLAGKYSTQAELIFEPKDTDYVNIGGVIGHNFVYKLREPWKEAKGTFTLFPRHSMLYAPISLFLFGGTDRFYINLYADRKLAGEGHIVDARRLKRAKIDGLKEMQRAEVLRDGKRFILLWRRGDLEQALRRTLDDMPEPASFLHFCCFAENKSFFLQLAPRKGKVSANLKAFKDACPLYFR